MDLFDQQHRNPTTNLLFAMPFMGYGDSQSFDDDIPRGISIFLPKGLGIKAGIHGKKSGGSIAFVFHSVKDGFQPCLSDILFTCAQIGRYRFLRLLLLSQDSLRLRQCPQVGFACQF